MQVFEWHTHANGVPLLCLENTTGTAWNMDINILLQIEKLLINVIKCSSNIWKICTIEHVLSETNSSITMLILIGYWQLTEKYIKGKSTWLVLTGCYFTATRKHVNSHVSLLRRVQKQKTTKQTKTQTADNNSGKCMKLMKR